MIFLSKRFRMSTALDVDDLLLECIPYAIKLANEKYNFNPPITIHEVDRWGKLGTRADVIFEFFEDPEFFKTQPVIKGAKEFVRKLSKLTEVFISTSIAPKFMGIRAERILEEFPEIPAEKNSSRYFGNGSSSAALAERWLISKTGRKSLGFFAGRPSAPIACLTPLALMTKRSFFALG